MTRRMTRQIWVTFAVAQEAAAFQRRLPLTGDPDVRALFTGMGANNARRVVADALAMSRPRVLISSGFAGGLNPALRHGEVLVEADDTDPWRERLLEAGAVRGRFTTAERVLVTAAEKAARREANGADAVEMESGAIRDACRPAEVPCVVARVISDAADEDLPLDFNALMGPDQRLRYRPLFAALLRAPGRVGALWTFQRRVRAASERLAEVLAAALAEQA